MRPSKDTMLLSMAGLLGQLGTCFRRKVGCILVNKHWHIIGSGYNGVAKGEPHCSESPCPGAQCESGQGLELCEAIHAEQNALLQCRDVQEIAICYVTTSPCVHCVKLLMNTGCHTIYFLNEYADVKQAKQLWCNGWRDWIQHGGQ
jgi:dCMP deaminase